MPKFCKICRIAKARNQKKHKGKSERSPEIWGEIVTGDHQSYKKMKVGFGLGGRNYAFNQLDLATRWKACTPVKSLTSDETYMGIRNNAGSQKVNLYYSDNFASIINRSPAGTISAIGSPGLNTPPTVNT